MKTSTKIVIAIVGSRNATLQGMQNAERFAQTDVLEQGSPRIEDEALHPLGHVVL